MLVDCHYFALVWPGLIVIILYGRDDFHLRVSGFLVYSYQVVMAI